MFEQAARHFEAEARLDRIVPGTEATQREHLAKVEKDTGKRPEPLNTPPLPEELGYVWNMYCEINSTEPLTFSEIRAYGELTGVRPSPLETRLLRLIDRIRRRVANER